MPKLPLECRIIHGINERDKFELAADPDDDATLQKTLLGWLRGKKWDKGKWREFEMVVRQAGTNRVLKRVRVPE